MSKKDRLKAQKEKQDRLRKEEELEEQREREEARERQSRSAKKMMKKAKRTKPNGEPVYYLILKLLMIVPFAYSGFFYGGVTIVGIMGSIESPFRQSGCCGQWRQALLSCLQEYCLRFSKNISFPLYLALGA